MTQQRRVRMTTERRAAQLLDTAQELFLRDGYENVTMEAIAREAEVTRAVVYRYYSSREEILVAGIRRARHALNAELARLPEATDPSGGVEEMVRAGARVFFGTLQSDTARWLLMHTSTLGVSPSTADELNRLQRETIQRIAELAQPAGTVAPQTQLDAFAFAISGVGEQLGRWWVDHSETPIDTAIEYYTEFVCRGISGIVA